VGEVSRLVHDHRAQLETALETEGVPRAVHAPRRPSLHSGGWYGARTARRAELVQTCALSCASGAAR